MKTQFLLAILALVIQATKPTSGDEPNPATPPAITAAPNSHRDVDGGIEFGIVPELLRLHLPELGAGHGVVVKRIDKEALAATDLEVGDIVLAIAGIPITDIHNLPKNSLADMVVLRRGQVIPLGHRSMAFGHRSPFPGWQSFAMPAQMMVTASAVATGNESIAISKNGDEMLIELSLPELASAPLRYRGTLEEIQQQIRKSSLSPTARQRVLDAIR